MDIPVQSSLLSLLFCLIAIIKSNSQPGSGDTNWWCDQTPHAEPCRYFASHTQETNWPQSRSGFRKVIIQVTLERALAAQEQLLHLRPKHESKRQRAVRADCLKLHVNTVLQLNRTLGCLAGLNWSCSDFDVQTWLSTALTNIETCRLGFRDLNVPDTIITPSTTANLSQLISDSLAVNWALLGLESEGSPSDKEKFPTWVSPKDRRLLQSSSVEPDLVVAKDGSGDYKTVQAAIDAAAQRSSTSSRLVIYVKRGVYAENIDVGINNSKIMLIGEGMRYTIITSSRSVKGGYTTYSSATAGTYVEKKLYFHVYLRTL